MVCRVHVPSMTVGLLLAALLMTIVGAGCSCSRSHSGHLSSDAERKEWEEKARQAAELEQQSENAEAVRQWQRTHPGGARKKPPPPPPPPPPSTSENASQTLVPGAQGSGGQSAAAQKPARPKDVAEWTPGDFFSARRDNDPRLIEAVTYHGKHFVTKESAELLAKLLEPPSADPAARRSPPRAATDPAMIEAVVAALVANGTTTARQILERLVSGTQETRRSSACGHSRAEGAAATAPGKTTKTCCSASSPARNRPRRRTARRSTVTSCDRRRWSGSRHRRPKRFGFGWPIP